MRTVVSVRRYSEAAAPPQKIDRIVNDIASLNLLETSALVKALKVKKGAFVSFFKSAGKA
jgi:hypothetical protein